MWPLQIHWNGYCRGLVYKVAHAASADRSRGGANRISWHRDVHKYGIFVGVHFDENEPIHNFGHKNVRKGWPNLLKFSGYAYAHFHHYHWKSETVISDFITAFCRRLFRGKLTNTQMWMQIHPWEVTCPLKFSRYAQFSSLSVKLP